jgi:hypothetical protein
VNRYSVYETGTDRPICIFGTPAQCAEALGIETHTFYNYLARLRSGRSPIQKIEIFKDDASEEAVIL